MTASVLKGRPPVRQSAFLLPTIDKAVPLSMADNMECEQIFARFALASEKVGVSLPGGDFDSIEQVVKRQWQAFAGTKLGDSCPVINCQIDFEVCKESLYIEIGALQDLTTIYIGAMIERLEAHAAGLGWFVLSVINRAQCESMECYSFEQLQKTWEMYFWDAKDDESFVRKLLKDMGTPLKKKEPITQEHKDAARDEGGGYLPSEILDAAGGQLDVLLGRVAKKAMSAEKAAECISKQIDPDLKTCVQDAIELAHLLKNGRDPFNWEMLFEDEDNEDLDDCYAEPRERIGAAALIVWESVELIVTLAQEHETWAMQAGTEAYILGGKRIPACATDEEFGTLASELSAYIDKWKKFNDLLSNFNNDLEDQEP